MPGAREVDRYGHHGRHVGSLALWLWGDKLGCVFALRPPCPGSGWRRCWVPLLKAMVPTEMPLLLLLMEHVLATNYSLFLTLQTRACDGSLMLLDCRYPHNP